MASYHRIFREVALAVSLALSYLLLAKLALTFGAVKNVTVVWPSSGLALAAVLGLGFRVWPGIFLGALATGITAGDPIGVSLLIATGNSLEPLIGAWLLRRFGFDLRLCRLQDYLRVLIFGALLSTLFSAVIGPGALLRAGVIQFADFSAVFLRWWMADAMGVMLAVPMILLWRSSDSRWRSRLCAPEAVLLLLVSLLLGGAVFLGWWQAVLGPYAKGFLMFTVLVWAALRFLREGVAVIILLTFALSLWGGILGSGYFGAELQRGTLLNFWLFHVAINLTGMTLALSLFERQEGARRLAQERLRLRRSEQRERNRNEVLEMLTTGSPLSEILDALVWGIEREFPERLGTIILLSDDGSQLSVGAAPSMPRRYLHLLEGSRAAPGISPCGDAICNGTRILVHDINLYPIRPDIREMLNEAGLSSCWSEPIRSLEGKVLGALSILAKRSPTMSCTTDLDGVDYAAQLSGIAIDRKRAHDEMQLAGLVYQAAGEGIMVTDEQNRVLAVNPAFTRLTGYNAEEAIGNTPKMLSSGQMPDSFYQSMWGALNTCGSWEGEIWNRRKDGELYAQWLAINVLRDAKGHIYRHIALFSDITQRKRAEETIWHQANYDVLTELPNRRLFRDRLEQDIKRAERANAALALLLIDLDFFKEINDSLGHEMGDLLLIEAAQRIGACIRESDTLARLGGDEFTVVLPCLAEAARIEQAAEAIMQSLIKPFQLGEETAYISASIGIAIYPHDAQTQEVLLRNADQAMYESKKRGRNSYSYFTYAMQERMQSRQQLIHDLREAVHCQQFEMLYQPVFDLRSDGVVQAEALMRWNHPQRGMVCPDEFIPLAEEIGLMGELGDWMLTEVANQLKRWADGPMDEVRICVNKSPRQFIFRNSEDRWLHYLRELEISPNRFVLEVTEDLLFDVRPEVAAKLSRYRAAGFKVAIDDFGTGYSSLSYVKRFGIDYLKIDQVFIQDLTLDENARALCEAIIVMAHKLGLEVIAEGVESQAQRQLLGLAGCDYGQGFWFSEPLAADEFIEFLHRQKDN